MKIAIFAPFRQKCGVYDYAVRMAGASPVPVDLIGDKGALRDGWDVLHVQYEPALFREGRRNVLPEVMGSMRAKKVVTLHEVYEGNPFVFPRPKRPGLLGFLKRARWDYAHRLERREEAFAAADFFADAVVVHTADAREILERRMASPGKVSVLPHPVVDVGRGDPRRGREKWGLPQGNIALVFGFITSVNDYGTLLDAAALLKESVTFVIAGSVRREEDRGPEADLDQAIRDRGLAKSVRRVGYVEKECLPDLFACADVFVSVPRVKTASGSVSHALGAALPVAAPDLPVFQEIRSESDCLWLFRPGDANSLSRAVSALLEEDENRRAREKAAEYATRHSIRAFMEEHVKIYRRLLEGGH
jgi:glycosyltransferase involved in cell wall biosynthesis